MCNGNCNNCIIVESCEEKYNEWLEAEADNAFDTATFEEVEPEECGVSPPTYGGVAW